MSRMFFLTRKPGSIYTMKILAKELQLYIQLYLFLNLKKKIIIPPPRA